MCKSFDITIDDLKSITIYYDMTRNTRCVYGLGGRGCGRGGGVGGWGMGGGVCVWRGGGGVVKKVFSLAIINVSKDLWL